ncbi:hypothetical protein NUU61_007663 [Penicillium alfredii]|uniref:Uncharacterized protein n=1 Tax=Penicillium alfredii TaxID=1506179 RepID=A0A9W9JYS2_9EURO|nr:uncharacterized protein NUU61_007663 [Penicillium alfredii]KAJ5086356.1 hypothetical protein NUU61_007663 [Penicillium alfredii]
MDAYPEDYVNHNLPLVLLSGLEAEDEGNPEVSINYPLIQEKGPKIFSDFPPLGGAVAEDLRRALLEQDGSQMPWKSRVNINGNPSASNIRFKIKSIGRSYRLPPRKSNPPLRSPPTSPTTNPNQDDSESSTSFALHSPISPLSPNSPTFPDGLLTPLWVTKHQDLVPATVINFFPLSQDPNMDSLRDNQLKIEINGLKREWASSGFKTRFLVVLIAEEGNSGYVGEVDDRVAGIRRATNLDPKSLFVITSDATTPDLKEFVDSLFSLLQPSVVEYYRDLSKHARRKRNRSSIPPPTAPPTSGTSQTLSFQGWNVRYEFKLGIFAEFRQEMDAACRNYESAYDTLFGQEVFENIAGWNLRFSDARLLADALAIRIIRCLLWTSQTTSATRFWVDHRIRTKDIIDRRGKGSKNYGWQAWEARWSMVMAQLIRRAEISFVSPTATVDQPGNFPSLYVASEKSIPTGERVNPWEQMHHEGYWLSRSAKHSIIRRTLAQQIPDEDRIPLDKTHIEAPQPGRTGFDHSHLILSTLKAALEKFSKRHQTRKVESLSLEIAEEYMRISSWSEAWSVLQPLWSTLSWRRSGWWPLMEKFGWALRECAFRVQDSETVLRVDWELLNKVFQPKSTWNYDIHRSLEGLPSEKPKPSVVLRAEDVMTSLTASLVLEKSEGNVGEPLQTQLMITSCAQPGSGPIRLSEVKVVFEGCLRSVRIQSNQDQNADTTTSSCIASVPLREPSNPADSTIQSPTSGLATLTGIADLTIGPSQTKIFNLTCIPREAGEARVASITLLVEEENFDLAYAITNQDDHDGFWWQETKKGVTRRRVGKDRDTGKCKVMPKPPKIRITTPNLRESYYTNERVVLRIGVHNEEEEAADVSAEIRLFGNPDSTAALLWFDAKDSGTQGSGDSSPTEGPSHFLKRTVGVMDRSSDKDLMIMLADTQDAAKYTLEISAVYHLVSDVQTPIMKTITVDVSFVRPFEANYEFLPHIHTLPWPDFFSVNDDLVGDQASSTPGGLSQRWCLNSKVVSFALEPLVIEKMSLVLVGLNGGTVCNIESEVAVSPETSQITPEELRESNFFLDLQKTNLGDRRPSTLNLVLEINWCRRASTTLPSSDVENAITTSILEIPRFVVPMGEPRVLASASASTAMSGLIHLEYTLENPSTHFLTFNLMMEASEHFAFSGPKTTVIQLVPLSRHTVQYNLLAAKRGLWIQPQLVVVDTYFNKTLRVLPTGEMRSDKKGVLVPYHPKRRSARSLRASSPTTPVVFAFDTPSGNLRLESRRVVFFSPFRIHLHGLANSFESPSSTRSPTCLNRRPVAMAAQAALIADTIVGMKRAMRRERDDSGPDDPIAQPTNRGNKMKANAEYVREGAMGYINSEDFYRQKVDHAGYTRHILRPNPVRYDSEGDELDEDDEDSEADAAAAEENPFSGIALETLLCPLKHPSELPSHPSMSQPYTSQALEHMTKAVETKLRQERALLWRARNLHRQFLGDSGWMPCGAVETPEDRWIFEPRIVDDTQSATISQQESGGVEALSVTGNLSVPQDVPSTAASVREAQQTQNGVEPTPQSTENDVDMAEPPAPSEGENLKDDRQEQIKEPKSEESDAMVKDLPPHPKTTDGSTYEINEKDHGYQFGHHTIAGSGERQEGMDTIKDGDNAGTETTHTEPNEAHEDENEEDAEMHDGSSPEPPRRMTTRAQANAGNQSPTSSADTASSLPPPHPLFLIPDHVRPDANFGLPAPEAEETRRLLWSYIQKQEETVRGFEHMLDTLLRACHMKSDVLEWCKAEGHVGEMSDGEDWYDREKWGLAEGEDLKKGTDEDEVETVDDSRTTAKRGRARR